MTEARVVGAAMTAFGKFPGRDLRALTESAVAESLADAGLAPGDVDIVFYANAVAGLITGQEMIRGQAALRHTGLLGTPIVNVENACASASTAFHLAVGAVASGTADVALAVGAEKMTHADRARTLSAIGTAIDLSEADELRRWADGGREGADVTGDGSARSFFMDIYAATTREYMRRTGATVEDFAAVAVKGHDHAALNPKAQYRRRVTIEEVLTSRPIAGPLTLLMCSPVGDGAAAVVVCSPERARTLDVDAVAVRACALVSGRGTPDGATAVERATAQAFHSASLGPGDLDVLELHDAAAPAELILYEEIGLCGPGDGPGLLRSGHTRLGGRQVVNPSGGLLCRGHPIGATGCAQIVELVDQLRGRCGARQVSGARVAMAENGGGYLGGDAAATTVTILSRRR